MLGAQRLALADSSQRVVDLPALIVLSGALGKVGLRARPVFLLELVHKVNFLDLVLIGHTVVYDEGGLVHVQVVLGGASPLQAPLSVPIPKRLLLAMKSIWLGELRILGAGMRLFGLGGG